EAAVPQSGLSERGDATTRGLDVDLYLPAVAVDAHPLLPQLLLRCARELERVDRLEVGLVAVALDPGGEAELVEQLRQLPRGLDDHRRIPVVRLLQVAQPQERLGEPVDRRQRCAQIVRG